MNHQWNVQLLRLFIERIPVLFMYAGCLLVSRWIRIEIGPDETELFNTAFKFRDAIACVLFLALRQLRHAAEAVRVELDDTGDDVVYRGSPEVLQKGSHPVPHRDRARADELNIDISVIHEFQMALLGVFQLLVGHLQFPPGRVLRHGFSEKLTERSRRGHVTVDINNFLTVMHKNSFPLMVQSSRVQCSTASPGPLNLEL